MPRFVVAAFFLDNHRTWSYIWNFRRNMVFGKLGWTVLVDRPTDTGIEALLCHSYEIYKVQQFAGLGVEPRLVPTPQAVLCLVLQLVPRSVLALRL